VLLAGGVTGVRVVGSSVDPAAVWPLREQMRAGLAGDVVVAKAADSSR
jgi:hypothetical protein